GGDVTLDTSVSIGDGPPDIRRISLQSKGLQINASGEGPGTPVALAARLSNLGVFLPGFQGALSTEGTIAVLDTEGRLLDIDLALAGPNGIQARLEGRAEDFGQELSLGLTGRAPVGAANRFIAPRTIEGVTDFDMRLDGAPGIEAISGRVTLSNARLSLPTLNNALTDLSGRVELAAGTAQITLGGSAGEGGRFDVTGPLNLAPPLNANLNVALRQLGISDPSLYSTSLTGDIGVSGALTRGPQIAGTIALGTTELRIPAGGAGPGSIPEITHRGEPSAVRITRKRAGLIEEATGGGGQPPQLDITVNAPNQVFLRGRGLDSELGGTIRVFGPTNDIGASGFFELIRGRLDILGKRLVLTEGLVDLRGALDPYLRIVAQTEADEVDINVIIEGLASSPEVSFTSSPELPEEEVAARLIFGKGIDQLSALQAARLVSAAATLSGRGGGLLGGIRGGLGLSDLDVGTTEDGGTEVRAGAYISDNLYSEIVVDSDGNEEINLNLDVSESLTVKGIASSDGNTGLGFFFERDY
ncbi:MAG: translocation/assembly module TamB domain-containing protein, partial [Pseudomonadota bacterium]